MPNGEYLLTMSCIGVDNDGQRWTWTEIDILSMNGKSLSHEEYGYMRILTTK